MARAVRIVTYEGPDAWLHATLARSIGGDECSKVLVIPHVDGTGLVEEVYRYVTDPEPTSVRLAAIDNREVWA